MQGLEFKPEERILDFSLGKDVNNEEVFYKELFFEWYIKNTLSSPRFRIRGLNLSMPSFQQRFNQTYLVRTSDKDLNNIYCKYERLEHPKIKIYELGEWNDYTKLTERFSFVRGLNSITLQKENYYLLFEYSTNKERAIEASKSGFESFKSLTRKINPCIRNRELNLETINSNKLKINFGYKKDNFHLEYEIVLQDEIFNNFIQAIK